MSDDHAHRADRYREIARELRCIAFKQCAFDLCRRDQLLSLAEGFDRFADRFEERTDEKLAAD